MGTGSFVPRELSIRFLAQLGSTEDLIPPQNVPICDMYFTLWLNTYSEQMSSELMPIDVDGGEVSWKFSVKNQWESILPQHCKIVAFC